MSTPWDRISKQVRLAGRSEDQPDEQGQRALARINELAPLRRMIEGEINKEVVRAREQGATWSALGRVLLMSKQGAQHHWRIAVAGPHRAVARTMSELPPAATRPRRPEPEPQP